MSGAVFTLGNSVSGSLGLGDAISKLGRVAATGLTIEQDPDTVNSYLTTRYAGLSAVTSGGVTTFLNPSLVVIPSAYNNGIVYSLHSKQVNTGDFTVTRNTEARRVNSAGQIASIGSGLPRLDYLTSGGTVGTPALLVEPAGTNLAFQSENFLTTWVLLSGTISTGTTAAFTAPDGTTNADLFTESTDILATNHQISQSISTAVISGTSYTFSCFFKATAANRSARLSLSSALFSGSPEAFFNVTSGIVGTTTDCTARIENYGSGWYRCIMTATCDVAGTASVFISSASGNTRDYIGNGSASLYLWGAQLETGSVATSYIPTTTGTGSRSADVISVTGAVSGSIGQTEGTIYWEGAIYRYDRVFFALSSGTSTSQAVRLQTTGAGLLQGIAISGSVQGNPQTSGAVTLGQFYKVAFAYKENDFVLYVNGVLQQSDPGGTLPTNLNSVYFCNSNGTEITDQRCRAVSLYTTRLTNQQLQLLTTL